MTFYGKPIAGRWADVKKGDSVELVGRKWTVVKIKPDGKRAAVKVEHGERTAKSVVKLKDAVKIYRGAAAPAKREPLHDEDAQRRWATEKEYLAAMGRGGLEAGDRTATEPSEKPKGKKWDAKPEKGTVEHVVGKALGARLVGESKDTSRGYEVPPVDVSTVAAHLAVFHGGIPEHVEDEGAMCRMHTAQHDAAKKGEGILAVNHWHTERRPS